MDIDENLGELDDSFDVLMLQLPVYSRAPQTINDHIGRQNRDDSFQFWLINRFNRVGPIPFFELSKRSLFMIFPHIKFLSITYFVYLMISLGIGYLKLTNLNHIWYSLFNVFSYSVFMSIHTNQKYFVSTKRMISISGIICIISVFLGTLLKFEIVNLLKIDRKSVV